MKAIAGLSAIFVVSSVLGALAMQAVDLGHVPWALNRASGLVAFALLSLSVITGLLISTKSSDGFMSRPFVFEMHQFLSVLSVVLIGVHMASLLFDEYLGFTALELVVPFLSPYQPVAMGVGVVGAWLCAITLASFWMRAQIGQKAWRMLHYATFAGYGASLWHGIAAGTDTRMAVVYWMYIGSLAVVAGLTTMRISGYRKLMARTARANRTGPAARAAGE